MTDDPEVARSLGYIRAATERLRGALAGLPPEGWDAPTNCPPWPVRRLVAHLISSGDWFRQSVERGVAGIVDAVVSDEERARRMDELSAEAPAELLAGLDEVTERFERAYDRLDARQLEAICHHRRGNRSARWYAQHRLAEVQFHEWDIAQSLGRHPELPDDVAAFLLPMLLESNLPRTYALRTGGDGRFRMQVEGDPPARWLLAARPGELEVARGDGDADVTIQASAAALALLVYGRVTLADLERQGRARVDGDRALATRFHDMFPGP